MQQNVKGSIDKRLLTNKSLIRRLCRFLCHQKEERCFKIRNYVFPICARCTGIVISFLVSLVCIKNKIEISFFVSILLLSVMFCDWILQYFNILMSTNKRRFLTGLIGGVGLTYFYYHIIVYFVSELLGCSCAF